MLNADATWLITGCSRGFGRALAEEVRARGYRLVATSRNKADILDIAQGYEQTVLLADLDVTKPDEIGSVVDAAQKRFGAVDVLVNNAGYGYLGAIEEGEDEEMRRLFETCLFGPINLIKAVLPGMRKRCKGHIVNVSSIGGIVTFAGVGYYNIVKAGVEALSDVLAKEVGPLGIDVTVVAPGAFRTDFRGPESVRQSKTRIAEYEETAGKARDGTLKGHGKQLGDPLRGVRAIIEAVEAEKPPVHFLIGSDALDQLRTKLDAMRLESDAWEVTTRGTDIGASP